MGARLALALLAALGAVLAACGGGGPVAPGTGGPGDPDARRLLPTNAAAVEFLVDLAGTDEVVGLPYTALEFCCVDLGDLPERVPTFTEFSAEVLLSFAPDLVVVSPWQNIDAVDRLEEAGVEVVVLPAVEGLEDVRRGLVEVGAALGADARAAALLADLDGRVAALTERVAARPGLRPRALSYTNYGSGGWGAGAGTTAALVMELAGLDNALAETGRTGHDAVDLEQLLDLDPDLYVVSKPSETYGVTRAYLEGEAALAGTRAVAGGAIAEVPANLYSTTSHHLVRAAEALADAVEALE